MKTYTNGEKNKITTSIPRNYDKIYTELFDHFLNIPGCDTITNITEDWIPKFIILFRQEVSQSFSKYKKYLKDLNDEFIKK